MAPTSRVSSSIYLDYRFPSLLKIPGFLVEFIAPIVKVTKGKLEEVLLHPSRV